MEFQSEQDCVTGTKNFMCSKSTNALCYDAKSRNVKSEMLCSKC